MTETYFPTKVPYVPSPRDAQTKTKLNAFKINAESVLRPNELKNVKKKVSRAIRSQFDFLAT